MKRNSKIELNPQLLNISGSFRTPDFFRDFFYLEPISAYPIHLWTAHLQDLIDTLSDECRQFLISFYSQQVEDLTVVELRLQRQRLFREVSDSFYFTKLLDLIRNYEDTFFCNFSVNARCPKCGAEKRDAFSSPLCGISLMENAFGRYLDQSLEAVALTKPGTDPGREAEISDHPEIDELTIQPLELDDGQVDTVLAQLNITAEQKQVGSLQTDGFVGGMPVIVWRPQVEISEEEIEFLVAAVAPSPLLVVVDEQFIRPGIQNPTIRFLPYSKRIFCFPAGETEVLTTQ